MIQFEAPFAQKLALVAVIGTVLAGCSSEPPMQNLDGKWSLQSIEVDGEQTEPVVEDAVLILSGGNGSGFSGCNNYRFSFASPGWNLFQVTSEVWMTRKACRDVAVSEFELEIVRMLSSSDSFVLEPHMLHLTGERGSLFFRRE